MILNFELSPPPLAIEVERGQSIEAKLLAELMGRMTCGAADTGSRQALACAALARLLWTASTPDWDGYGAKAVSLQALEGARRILAALPATVPLPELNADPDGEVSLEWYLQPRQVFSISVSEWGDLSYAGLFGPNRIHGVEILIDRIPAAISDQLRRLYGNK